MRYPAYSKYKDSRVQWLGEVPEHWELKRSDGILISDRNQLSPESFKDEEVFHYSIPAVQEYGTGIVEEGETIASAKQKITEKCLLVSKLNPRKATICIAAPQEIKTLCSTEFVVLKTRKCALDYLCYFTQTEIFRQGLDSKVQSVTRSHQRAKPEDIYKFWAAWPSITEQKSIANFLDQATGKIDTLVAKKRALVGLLKEKRTALISRTVTRGLPAEVAREFGLEPHTRFKESGIEWLGEIPANWELWKMTHICSKILDGTHFSPKSEASGEYKYITAKNIKEMGLNLSNLTYVSEEDHRVIYARCPVRKNDILYIKDGATAGIATVNTLDEEFSMLSSVALLRPVSTLLEPRYLSYQLNSVNFKKYVLNGLVGGAMTRFTLDIIKRFRLVLPSLSEQNAISDYLDRETTKIDNILGKVESVIDRLQEYRTALITAAVTGKIDVREAGA